jgi:hypothetical protein
MTQKGQLTTPVDVGELLRHETLLVPIDFSAVQLKDLDPNNFRVANYPPVVPLELWSVRIATQSIINRSKKVENKEPLHRISELFSLALHWYFLHRDVPEVGGEGAPYVEIYDADRKVCSTVRILNAETGQGNDPAENNSKSLNEMHKYALPFEPGFLRVVYPLGDKLILPETAKFGIELEKRGLVVSGRSENGTWFEAPLN